jgi:hypothetical protein
MKIHPGFFPNRLRKASQNPLPGQVNPEPPPVNVTGDGEWQVQEIPVSNGRTYLYYCVKWLNRDEDLLWSPASECKYAPHKVRDFHLANPA